jgi:hypothetical protein
MPMILQRPAHWTRIAAKLFRDALAQPGRVRRLRLAMACSAT